MDNKAQLGEKKQKWWSAECHQKKKKNQQNFNV